MASLSKPESTEFGNSTAVARAVDEILDLILSRILLPGEQLRQDAMASKLEMSKVPIREALRVLETQGFIQYERYRGYFVSRFSPADLEQFYLMRRLLEGEILGTVSRPTEEQINELRALNNRLAETQSVAEQTTINRQFHFAIFDLSPLHRLVSEVDRLWTLSESYRALYLANAGVREVVTKEHETIMDALEVGDTDTLIKVHEAHRARAETFILEKVLVI